MSGMGIRQRTLVKRGCQLVAWSPQSRRQELGALDTRAPVVLGQGSPRAASRHPEK